MADKDHNRFESNKKWIVWKGLSDGETLLYSHKNYNKLRDEEALKQKRNTKLNKQMIGRGRDKKRLGRLKDLE